VICGSELPHPKLLLLCIQTFLSGVLVITAFMRCVTLQRYRFYANYYNNTNMYYAITITGLANCILRFEEHPT